jgi:hypothetical protein
MEARGEGKSCLECRSSLDCKAGWGGAGYVKRSEALCVLDDGGVRAGGEERGERARCHRLVLAPARARARAPR